MNKEEFLTDGDYSINLNNVIAAYCILEKVTYIKKPTLKDYETGNHNVIKNIRSFYVSKYCLVTQSPEGWGETEHDITKYLFRAKGMKKGRHNFHGLYGISNDYAVLQQFQRGLYPKDLFHPIKHSINEALFDDSYKIKDFYVKGKFSIKSI